jgi:AraC-like DNA-binding protein
MNTAITVSILVLSTFIIVQLITEPKKSGAANYFLAILILLAVSQVPPLVMKGLSPDQAQIFEWFPIKHWVFLLGPLLLFYTFASIGRKIKVFDILHFLPLIIWWILYIAIQGIQVDLRLLVRIYGITNLISLIFYGLLIQFILRKYTQSLRDQYSYSDIFLEIKWLSYIASVLVVLSTVLGIIISITPKQRPERAATVQGLFRDPELITILHGLAILSFIFIFSIMAQKQERSSWEILIKSSKTLKNSDKEDLSQDEKHYSLVSDYMNSSRIYLDSKLSLQQLSDKVDISRNELSALINRATGENFFHFVNGYRAREYEQILLRQSFSDYTLLAIAYECGFNSKSTFNVAVKKEFGKTPSQIFKEISPTL